MRKIITDEDGTKRYEINRLVRFLFDSNDNMTFDTLWKHLNGGLFNIEEMKEFYQLIGYSIDGYNEIFEGKE